MEQKYQKAKQKTVFLIMSKGIHILHIHAIQVEKAVWWTIIISINTVLYFKNTLLSMAVTLVITVVSKVVHVNTVVSGVVHVVTVVSGITGMGKREEWSSGKPCGWHRTEWSSGAPGEWYLTLWSSGGP